LYNLLDVIRIISILIYPIMPDTSETMLKKIGYGLEVLNRENLEKDLLHSGVKVVKGDPIFQRIDVKGWKRIIKTVNINKEDEVMSEIENVQNIVEIEDFKKIDLRVAKVVKAENIEKSNKLLRLHLDLGQMGERQVIAGIKSFYSPEDLVDKKIIIIANLKPAKLMGELSEGMLLAAKDGNGNLSVLTVDKDVEPGSKIS